MTQETTMQMLCLWYKHCIHVHCFERFNIAVLRCVIKHQ